MGEVDIAGVFHLLGEIAKDVRDINRTVNEHTKVLNDHTRVLNEHSRMLGEHGRMLRSHESRLDDLQHGMRDIHGTLIGHGILLHELDERLRRVEKHVGLPPAA